MTEFKWSNETIQQINKLTPEITRKSFHPGWFLLRQRFEQYEQTQSELIAALEPFAKYACDEHHIDEPMCQNCVARAAITKTLGDHP